MFIYKGIKSKDMFLRVLNPLTFSSPSREVKVVQVPGRHGEVVIDQRRFNSVSRSLTCRLENTGNLSIEALISNINQWLVADGQYHPFQWENDDEFQYYARVEGSVMSHRLLETLAETVIDFRFHPLKYVKDSLELYPINSGMSIINPFPIHAKPLIHIIGSGDIEILIAEKLLVLKEIEAGCIIDSETQTITDLSGENPLFNKMFSPFPQLKEGENSVSFSNDLIVKIAPRLGVLI